MFEARDQLLILMFLLQRTKRFTAIEEAFLARLILLARNFLKSLQFRRVHNVPEQKGKHCFHFHGGLCARKIL